MPFFNQSQRKSAQKKESNRFWGQDSSFFAPISPAVKQPPPLMFSKNLLQKKTEAEAEENTTDTLQNKLDTIQKLDGPWRLGKRHANAAKKAKALGNTAREGENDALDAAKATLEATGITGTVSNEYGARGNAGLSSTHDKNLGVAGGSADFVSMFTGIATAVKTFKDADSTADKAGAVISGIHSGMTGAKGASAIVDKAAKIHLDNTTGIGASALAAGNIAGITDAFAAIKETFFVVKEIIELVKEAQSMSSEEKFRASMSIIRHSLDAAQSGVSAVRSFLDTWGGGVAAPLMQSTPGLGIAFSCADLVMEGVSLVTSEIRKADMRKKKQALKLKIGGAKGTSSKVAAEAILANTGSTPEQKADATEYLLAKSVQYINQKRSNRRVVPILSAMLQIAGDATTLGGVSAPVGIGLKAGATALKFGASAFRSIKQVGNNKAATSAADSTWRKVFNADKSSDAKQAGYNKMINDVFDMIIAADGKADPDREPAMQNCADYLSGIGFSVEAMHRYRTDPDMLRQKMIAALKNR